MDLPGSIVVFENIKIEADSDCAFFGSLATAVSEDDSSAAVTVSGNGTVSTLDTFESGQLNTLLSSVSPYSISPTGSPGGSSGNASPSSVSRNSSSNGMPPASVAVVHDASIEDSINPAFFSTAEIAELELDLPDFSCDFDDILDEDVLMDSTSLLPSTALLSTTSALPDDSDSKDSGTSSDLYLHSPCSMDTPPLTPPSPGAVIKVESETKSLSPCSQVPANMIPMLKNLPPGGNLNLTKILPALKSSRGRSASHDSPDVQALKRHIRMIRNRESASLSRKKKKEYVTTLEQRLKELETENAQLKQENHLLKTRLLMQQQQSATTTATPTATTKSGGRHNQSGVAANANHNKSKLIAKVALLGVCCFMVLSTNAPVSRNPHFKMDNNNALSNDTVAVTKDITTFPHFRGHLASGEFPTNHIRISRSLAWHDDFKEGSGRRKKITALEEDNLVNVNRTTLEIPPEEVEVRGNRSSAAAVAKKASPVSVTTTTTSTVKYVHVQSSSGRQRPQPQQVPVVPSPRHSYRNVTLPLRGHDINNVPTSNCKAPFNQTESLRVQNDLKGLFSRGKPKKKYQPKPFFYSTMDLHNADNNKGLTVYDQRMQKYSNFLDKIQLREDTFYVVSLAMDDQLLLSAKSSNASSRPKMSFLMPWRNVDSLGGKEEVMQIDCEVTKVLNLNKIRKASKS